MAGVSLSWCEHELGMRVHVVQADVRACAGKQLRLRDVQLFPCAG
jgi:hypothetical protein